MFNSTLTQKSKQILLAYLRKLGIPCEDSQYPNIIFVYGECVQVVCPKPIGNRHFLAVPADRKIKSYYVGFWWYPDKSNVLKLEYVGFCSGDQLAYYEEDDFGWNNPTNRILRGNLQNDINALPKQIQNQKQNSYSWV